MDRNLVHNVYNATVEKER